MMAVEYRQSAAGPTHEKGAESKGMKNRRRFSWRSCDIEATLPGVICPPHGEEYDIPRRDLPLPPPQLVIAGHRNRSRSAAGSTTHQQARCVDSADTCCTAPDSPSNGWPNLAEERGFSSGYGWAEPGKGWTRIHRPSISCAGCRPDVHKYVRTCNDSTAYERSVGPSARDVTWALSYLSREDGAPRENRVLRNIKKQSAVRNGRRHGPELAPPGGIGTSSISRRRRISQLAETQVMKHKLESARSYNKGLRTCNSELARQVVAFRRKVEAIAWTTSTTDTSRTEQLVWAATMGDHVKTGSMTDKTNEFQSGKINPATECDESGTSSLDPSQKHPSNGYNCRKEEQGRVDVEQDPTSWGTSPTGRSQTKECPAAIICSPLEERRKNNRAAIAHTRAEVGTHVTYVTNVTDMKAANLTVRSDANAQTQTEEELLAGDGVANGGAPSGQRRFVQEDKPQLVGDRHLLTGTIISEFDAEERKQLKDHSAVVAGDHSPLPGDRGTTCEETEQASYSRAAAEPSLGPRRDSKRGEAFFSCRGSEPGAGGTLDGNGGRIDIEKRKQKPRDSVCGNNVTTSGIQGLERHPPSLKEDSPTRSEQTTFRESIELQDHEDVVVIGHGRCRIPNQRHANNSSTSDSEKCRGAGIGVTPSPALGVNGDSVNIESQARHGDQRGRHSNTSTAERSAAVERRDDRQAMRPPASSCLIGTSLVVEERIEVQQTSPGETQKATDGKARAAGSETISCACEKNDAAKEEVKRLEQKLRSTKHAVAAFKIVFLLTKDKTPDGHDDAGDRLRIRPKGIPQMVLAFSRWRALRATNINHSLYARNTGDLPEAFSEGRIGVPESTAAAAAPAVAGMSSRPSPDGSNGGGWVGVVLGESGDGTIQRIQATETAERASDNGCKVQASDDNDRLSRKQYSSPRYPPMPPIPPRPRPRQRQRPGDVETMPHVTEIARFHGVKGFHDIAAYEGVDKTAWSTPPWWTAKHLDEQVVTAVEGPVSTLNCLDTEEEEASRQRGGDGSWAGETYNRGAHSVAGGWLGEISTTASIHPSRKSAGVLLRGQEVEQDVDEVVYAEKREGEKHRRGEQEMRREQVEEVVEKTSRADFGPPWFHWVERSQDNAACAGVDTSAMSILPSLPAKHYSSRKVIAAAEGSASTPNRHDAKEEKESGQMGGYGSNLGEMQNQDARGFAGGWLGETSTTARLYPSGRSDSVLQKVQEAKEQVIETFSPREKEGDKGRRREQEMERGQEEEAVKDTGPAELNHSWREVSTDTRKKVTVQSAEEDPEIRLKRREIAARLGGTNSSLFVGEVEGESTPEHGDTQDAGRHAETGLDITHTANEGEKSDQNPSFWGHDAPRKKIQLHDEVAGRQRGELREHHHASCSIADENHDSSFFRRDDVSQSDPGVENKNTGRGHPSPGFAAGRQEVDEGSPYRRDCAVLAGTAKIVFALLALQHRRVSSRFYLWKRRRPSLESKGRSTQG